MFLTLSRITARWMTVLDMLQYVHVETASNVLQSDRVGCAAIGMLNDRHDVCCNQCIEQS